VLYIAQGYRRLGYFEDVVVILCLGTHRPVVASSDNDLAVDDDVPVVADPVPPGIGIGQLIQGEIPRSGVVRDRRVRIHEAGDVDLAIGKGCDQRLGDPRIGDRMNVKEYLRVGVVYQADNFPGDIVFRGEHDLHPGRKRQRVGRPDTCVGSEGGGRQREAAEDDG